MKEKDITRTLQLVRQVQGEKSNQKTKQDFVHTADEVSIGDVFTQAFRHKIIILAAFLSTIALAVSLYAFVGTWFQREVVAQFNNYENNSLFFLMDTLVPSGDTDRKINGDNRQDHAARAMNALGSDGFLLFCFERAKADKELAKFLKIDHLDAESKLDNATYVSLRSFFNNFFSLTAPEGGGGLLRLKSSGFFIARFKDIDRTKVETGSEMLSKLMNDYLSKREIGDIQATRQLVKEKVEIYRQEVKELTQKRNEMLEKINPFSPEAYSQMMVAVQNAKAALAGNKIVQARFSGLLADIEEKMSSFYKQEAINSEEDEEEILAFNEGRTRKFKREVKKIDDDLSTTLENLQTIISRDFDTDLSSTAIQQNYAKNEKLSAKSTSVYILKQQAAYQQAKIQSLESSLQELRKYVNDRYVFETQKLVLDGQISAKEKLVQSLDSSLIRLELADFKTLRRIEMFYGPIEFKSVMPMQAMAVLACVLGLLLGIFLGFLRERSNPSLKTVRDFEDLSVPVLGSVPSTAQFLMRDVNSSALHDPSSLSYVRLGINLGNILTYMQSKIALFTAAESPHESATIVYNLATYFSKTGRKTLLIESDFSNNYLAKLTGAPLNGGLSDMLLSSTEVNIKPTQLDSKLHILTGDPEQLPIVYRLASEQFLDLLDELKKEYDYILIHARPCLESPEAADISRYAGVSVICADASRVRISLLDRLTGEMKLFLSRYSFFVLEKTADTAAKYRKSKIKNFDTRKIKRVEKEPSLKKAS